MVTANSNLLNQLLGNVSNLLAAPTAAPATNNSASDSAYGPSNPYFSAIEPLFGPNQYAGYSQTLPLLLDLTGGGPLPTASFPDVNASQFTPFLTLLGIV